MLRTVFSQLWLHIGIIWGERIISGHHLQKGNFIVWSRVGHGNFCLESSPIDADGQPGWGKTEIPKSASPS